MWYLWRRFLNLEFLEVRVLDEIYTGGNGEVEYISHLDRPSGGQRRTKEASEALEQSRFKRVSAGVQEKQ